MDPPMKRPEFCQSASRSAGLTTSDPDEQESEDESNEGGIPLRGGFPK
jgi:hypothetical protein